MRIDYRNKTSKKKKKKHERDECVDPSVCLYEAVSEVKEAVRLFLQHNVGCSQ